MQARSIHSQAVHVMTVGYPSALVGARASVMTNLASAIIAAASPVYLAPAPLDFSYANLNVRGRCTGSCVCWPMPRLSASLQSSFVFSREIESKDLFVVEHLPCDEHPIVAATCAEHRLLLLRG